MSLVPVTYWKVTYWKVRCGRADCARDSGLQGRTDAFPTQTAALDDWVSNGGSVDGATGVTLCNWHQPEQCEWCGNAATGKRDGSAACPDHLATSEVSR